MSRPAAPTSPTRRVAAIAALAAVLATGAASAAGIDIHAGADAADIGLPVYPGAVKKGDKPDEDAGFTFGLWGGPFGMKLVVVSLRSTDGVEPVAGYYRDALAKYGVVLDCSQNKPRSGSKKKSASINGIPDVPGMSDIDTDGKKPLVCGDDAPPAGGRLYKVGTRADQRIFEAKPLDVGTGIQLVRIEARGTD